MGCRATTYDVDYQRVVIRQGYWDGTTGFGWKKTYWYHNLYLQPTIDTIAFSATGLPPSDNMRYTVYHHNPEGFVDQEVEVYVDEIETTWGYQSTKDGHMVGELGGFCLTGGGVDEPECPEWVDVGSHSL
jgi:hypothetical protein